MGVWSISQAVVEGDEHRGGADDVGGFVAGLPDKTG